MARRAAPAVPPPPRPAPAPVSDWRDVRPGAVYTRADVCALLRVNEATALRWCAAGKVRHLPRATRNCPYRFLGSELLRLLGDQAGALPAPAETPAERRARGEAARERIRHLAGGIA